MDKALKKLRRPELLEVILQYAVENETSQKRIETLETELGDRREALKAYEQQIEQLEQQLSNEYREKIILEQEVRRLQVQVSSQLKQHLKEMLTYEQQRQRIEEPATRENFGTLLRKQA